MRRVLSAALGLAPSVHAWLTRASGDDVDLPVAGMPAGMCADRGLAGLAAEGAYWLALGGFAVAGGHEPSLHAGARVHCSLEGVRSYAVVLRVGVTSLLVTPDGGERTLTLPRTLTQTITLTRWRRAALTLYPEP